MSLGLSHSLSRHKLKFSPDKVDTMIVQAIALLDDLDKELNTYAMRVKEWYGWHFPEMGRIVNDNLAYAKVILKMGMRSNASNADLAEILPEVIEGAVKAAAEVSMGTEITSEDLDNIQALAEQVVSFTEYRQQLSSYLSARMTAIAPNLTTLVGELVGARLIAHAGSLLNLAKSPASTIQILGAEKALFRALKTKHDTPKYGLIYHASLIGQASGKNKGKIARMLATKAAIGLRVDALADWGTNSEGNGVEVTEEEKAALGVELRLKIERRLRALEGKPLLSKGIAIGPNGRFGTQAGKWEVKEARKYNPDADGLAGDEPAATSVSKSVDGPKRSSDKKPDVKMIEEVDEEDEKDEEDEESEKDQEVEDEQDKEGADEEDDEMDEGDEIPESNESTTAHTAPTIDIAMVTNGSRQNGDDAPSESPAPENAVPSSSPPKAEEPTSREALKAARKEAKIARKKAEKDQKQALAERKSEAKAARKAKRKALGLKGQPEPRPKSFQKIERHPDTDQATYEEQARLAGLTVSRYLKKLERGKIFFDKDGTPMALTKKQRQLKKMADNIAAKAAAAAVAGEKRKREGDEGDEGAAEADEGLEKGNRAERRKKKKQKSRD